MNINVLEVFKSPVPKKKIGHHKDGGYVICMLDNLNYDLFLSAGVSDDTSFEEHFLREYPDVVCYAFDGTIEKLPETSPKTINLIRKNIGYSNNDSEEPHTTNLHNYFEKYDKIFLKMDIEGHEFPWIHSLSIDQLKKIKQLVIEFHYPIIIQSHWDCLAKLKETHWLVHINPHNGLGYVKTLLVNNLASDTTIGHEIIIPYLMECTYISKDLVNGSLEFNEDPIPSPLDHQHTDIYGPIKLSGYPYSKVFKSI